MILLIFDIDGTLTNTTTVDNHCFAETYKEIHQVDWDNFNWDGVDHVSDTGLANAYFKQRYSRLPTQSELEQLQIKFMDLLTLAHQDDPNQFKEIKGAKSIIQQLNVHPNYQLAMATGCWKPSALFKLKAAQIPFEEIPLGHANHHFDRMKITRKAIQLARVRYNYPWDHIVYIGDGIWDAQTTQKLEIPFVGIDFNRDDKLQQHGVKTIISHYEDLDQFELVVKQSIDNFENKT